MEINNDKMVECAHCGSKLCYERKEGEVQVKLCLTCGFQTNEYMHKDGDLVKSQTENLPEIYKVLMHEDKDGMIWMPSFVKVNKIGMIFIQGTSKDDYKWAAVKDTPIPMKDKKKYPIPGKKKEYYTHKSDMKTLKVFEPDEYIKAYFYLFNTNEL